MRKTGKEEKGLRVRRCGRLRRIWGAQSSLGFSFALLLTHRTTTRYCSPGYFHPPPWLRGVVRCSFASALPFLAACGTLRIVSGAASALSTTGSRQAPHVCTGSSQGPGPVRVARPPSESGRGTLISCEGSRLRHVIRYVAITGRFPRRVRECQRARKLTISENRTSGLSPGPDSRRSSRRRSRTRTPLSAAPARSASRRKKDP